MLNQIKKSATRHGTLFELLDQHSPTTEVTDSFPCNKYLHAYNHAVSFNSFSATLFIVITEAGAPSTSHTSPNRRLSESSSLTATMNLGEKFWSYSSGYSMRPNFILCVLTVLSPLVQLCVYVFF